MLPAVLPGNSACRQRVGEMGNQTLGKGGHPSAKSCNSPNVEIRPIEDGIPSARHQSMLGSDSHRMMISSLVATVALPA
ncbi:hypothetical protein CBM2626_A260054 [Cupriavidus taiwanensis]|nr:hypothetical protein CBM2626_A260054 [Cupriavidus taiwanensis]